MDLDKLQEATSSNDDEQEKLYMAIESIMKRDGRPNTQEKSNNIIRDGIKLYRLDQPEP